MDLGLRGAAVLITGAGRGLGRAAAEALASEGARIMAVARSGDELADLAAAWPGQVEVQVCDMTDREHVGTLVEHTVARWGSLDVLVNNAGIAPASAFVEQDMTTWDQVFEVNVGAPALLCRDAGRHMLDKSSGSIINVASTTGLRGKGSLGAYSASKGALLRLTEALAAEWTRQGVRVNAIAPGAFHTRAQRAVVDDPELLRKRVRRIPAGRMGMPEEFGSLVCYLSSSASSFVAGSTFVIDGGESGKL